jgi:hypothetical protein
MMSVALRLEVPSSVPVIAWAASGLKLIKQVRNTQASTSSPPRRRPPRPPRPAMRPGRRRLTSDSSSFADIVLLDEPAEPTAKK